MGYAVACAAGGEFAHHGIRMGNAVAVLALRNHFVFCFMAVGTGDILMLIRAGLQQVVRNVMAGSAEFGRDVVRIGDRHRHVCLMAGEAIGLDHVIGMGAVTVGAVRNFAMGGMTGGTEKLGMFCRVLTQLVDLFGMAGQTGVGMLVGQGNHQRGMRIGVAAQAVFQFVMVLAGMAHAALGYNVGVLRRMTLVAVDAGNTGLMFHPLFFNGLGGRVMTLRAVIRAQCGPGFIRG